MTTADATTMLRATPWRVRDMTDGEYSGTLRSHCNRWHEFVTSGWTQVIRTRRVMWPLASQYVRLLARNGSSGAGWMFPSVSMARDVTVCSPRAGAGQGSVQNR